MSGQWNELSQPTPEQVQMTKKVERALANEINLQAREGAPVACVLTALGMTIADLITTQAGPEGVVPWFVKQAAMLRELQGGAPEAN
jgi:hypothetical protein